MIGNDISQVIFHELAIFLCFWLQETQLAGSGSLDFKTQTVKWFTPPSLKFNFIKVFYCEAHKV